MAAGLWGHYQRGIVRAPEPPREAPPGKGSKRTRRVYQKQKKYISQARKIFLRAFEEFNRTATMPDAVFDPVAVAEQKLSWVAYEAAHSEHHQGKEMISQTWVEKVATVLVTWWQTNYSRRSGWRYAFRLSRHNVQSALPLQVARPRLIEQGEDSEEEGEEEATQEEATEEEEPEEEGPQEEDEDTEMQAHEKRVEELDEIATSLAETESAVSSVAAVLPASAPEAPSAPPTKPRPTSAPRTKSWPSPMAPRPSSSPPPPHLVAAAAAGASAPRPPSSPPAPRLVATAAEVPSAWAPRPPSSPAPPHLVAATAAGASALRPPSSPPPPHLVAAAAARPSAPAARPSAPAGSSAVAQGPMPGETRPVVQLALSVALEQVANKPPILPATTLELCARSAKGLNTFLLRHRRRATAAIRFVMGVLDSFPQKFHAMPFGSTIAGTAGVDSDTDVCLTLRPPITMGIPMCLAAAAEHLDRHPGVNKVKVCDWKRSLETLCGDMHVDILFSSSCHEANIKAASLLAAHLEDIPPEAQGAIHVLVNWAKVAGFCKRKHDRKSVASIGRKGVHWAWLGMAAVRWTLSLKRDQPATVAGWIYRIVAFLVDFPYRDVAMAPQEGDRGLFLLRNDLPGGRIAGVAAVLWDQTRRNTMPTRPPRQFLETVMAQLKSGNIPHLNVLLEQFPEVVDATAPVPPRPRTPPRDARVAGLVGVASASTPSPPQVVGAVVAGAAVPLQPSVVSASSAAPPVPLPRGPPLAPVGVASAGSVVVDLSKPVMGATWSPAFREPGGGKYNVHHPLRTVVTASTPVLLFVPGAGSTGSHPRDTVPKKKKNIADLGWCEKFIVVQAHEATPWKTQPWFWLVQMIEWLRKKNPARKFHMVGVSKGAWWGALFVAAYPCLFHGVVLIGGYSTPRQLPAARAAEGREVAAGAASTQLLVIFSSVDECCPYVVERPFLEAMANMGVPCFDTQSGHSMLHDEFIFGLAPYLTDRAGLLMPAWRHMQAVLAT